MFGVELTPEEPISQLAHLAEIAENVGFDTVFASHHYNNRDEFLALGEVAAAISDVRLGPGVTNPYETHPVALASRMATLDELAEGRGVFGIGAGDRSTLSNLGVERSMPLRRVLETVQVSRRLWEGERVDHDGTFVARDASLNYEAGDIPIYVGAQGPDMTRMAAKYADGVLFNGSHQRDVEWAAERVAEGKSDRPAQLGDLDFGVYASVSVANEANSARESARPPVAFIVGGSASEVLDRHGIDRKCASRIGEAIEEGAFREAFEGVTEEMIDAFCIAGTPASVAEEIDEILAVADSFVMGSPLGPDLEAALELMDTVLPRNRE